MAELVALVIFVLLSCATCYFGYTVYARPGRVVERLSQNTSNGPSMDHEGERPATRIIRHLGEKMPVSAADSGLIRRYLIAAGFRSERAFPVFYGLKAVGAAAGLLCAVLLMTRFNLVPVLQLIAYAGLIFGGWSAPNFVLESRITGRQEKLRLSLPDALDLMVVCVEAGHGLDQAFVRVGKELQTAHPEICDEFGLVNMEIRAGKRRTEALHNLAERTGEPELRNLVSILIQADRFGTSTAESLRTHADFMRVQRRQNAEERANKLGVKLVFPIFFFILPAMMVVTAGPGILRIFKFLLPALRQHR